MYTSIQDIRTAVNNGETTLKSVVESYIEKIKVSKTNSFIESFDEEALSQAETIEAKIKEGKAGKLAGLVIGLKDNICYKNHKVTAASKILDNFESLFDATVTERLLADDAIIIGRLNCDEFAMGSTNENSAYGPTLNPIDLERVPGGSSGASAAAVAEGLCTATLGTDTGGSVRQPAAFCGVVGLKPTYGRISRHGIIAYGSSFDQVGVFANNIEDTAIITEVIAGQDEFDATSAENAVDTYSEHLDLDKKLKIGYLKDCVEHPNVDQEITSAIQDSVEKLKAEGHTVEEVDFPYTDYMVPTYYVLTTAEASSNLARYDGIHYGYRSENAHDTESTYVDSRTEGFGIEVKRRIMTGTFVLSAGYYDAYYGKAQKVRNLITKKTLDLLSDYDMLILPTTPETPFKHGEKSDDPVTMYLSDIFTVQANLTGVPAISLPLKQHSNGLPIAIQVMANKFDEKGLFAFSKEMMDKVCC